MKRLLALIFIPLALHAEDAAKPLNVLLVTADDMNADSPGWMGNPLKPTPNIDAFAQAGHRFTNNHVSAPICQPSRAAIMTGRVPHRSGGLGFNPINEGVPTLVTVLKEKGYFTGALNKLPHMKPESAFPWDVTFDASAKNPDLLGKQLAEAIGAAKAADKPFFINCNIGDPHRPFYGAEGKKGAKRPKLKLDDEGDAGSGKEGGVLAHVYQSGEVKTPAFLEDLPGIREEIAQYTNSIQRLDLSFGKVLAALEASGMADRTLVVFLSDHGISMPFSKATVYRNGTWSPVVLRIPGKPGASVHEEMTSSTDLLPTILELVSVKAPEGVDGRSWVPLLNGEKQEGRDKVFTHVNGVSSGIQFPQRAVNTRSRSLIFLPWSGGRKFKVEAMQGLTFKALDDAARTDERIRGRVEQYITGETLALYDTEKDPEQRKNVIADPAYAEDLKDLKASLLAHMQKTGDPQLNAFKAALEDGKVSSVK